MNKPMHTPGPWNIQLHDDIDTGDIRGVNNEEIALCCMPDAALIAAAPEMLEALKSIPDHVLDCQHKYPHITACWNCIVKAAITKAEGETHATQ